MEKPKRVLCIMDMAFVGRSSLAVVLPVLSSCGVQTCPFPPLLLSSHTGGFGEVARVDITTLCEQALQQYKTQNIDFDAIYIGYLSALHQFDLAEATIAQYPDAFVLVDPAMGDGGKPYSGITSGMIDRMRKLCKQADLITPNITECALLLGVTLENTIPPPLEEWIDTLIVEGQTIVVTSAPAPPNSQGMGVAVKAWQQPLFILPVEQVPQNYPGTGDLFAASLMGLLFKAEIQQATRQAIAFVGAAVHETYKHHGESRHGVWFEKHLALLTQANNN